jgi:hypothetical protein
MEDKPLLGMLPHSPNWDSLRACDYVEPYLAYVSNEQVFVLGVSSRGFSYHSTLSLSKVKRTRCLSLALIPDYPPLVAIALKGQHLIAVKKIGSISSERLVQANFMVVRLHVAGELLYAIGRKGEVAEYDCSRDFTLIETWGVVPSLNSGEITAVEFSDQDDIAIGTDAGLVVIYNKEAGEKARVDLKSKVSAIVEN